MRFTSVFDNHSPRELLATSLLILLTIIALRFDYTYSMLPYQIVEGDTLEGILEQRLFHDQVIANASVDYIRETKSEYDVDFVMKNIGRQGGYRVEVWFNTLSIYGPNNSLVVRSNLLDSSPLLNHLLQVAVHNLVVIAIASWTWHMLKQYHFKLDQRWRREMLWPGVALSFLFPVLFVVAIYILFIMLALLF